jgi:hypothetical protein
MYDLALIPKPVAKLNVDLFHEFVLEPFQPINTTLLLHQNLAHWAARFYGVVS